MPLAYVLAGNWRKPNSLALLMPAVETKYFGIVSYAEESAVFFLRAYLHLKKSEALC